MLFRTHIPGPPLSELIYDFWLYEDYEGSHPRERILPSGTFEMVFNLREDELRVYGASGKDGCRRFSGALMSGPYAGSFMSDAAEEAGILGVHFRPGGAARVLGLPAGDLANTHIDLQAIWGRAASVLRERLCALSEPADRFRLLEQTLLTRLADASACHGAVRVGLELLTRTHGRAKIRDVARDVELSPRRFIDVFSAEVGSCPQ
jgi:AraC-like DNA-binding protein